MNPALLKSESGCVPPRGGAAGPQVRLPNLLVIGAMKASTTTFYELITRHPDVWFPGVKEPHYFTSNRYGDLAAWREYAELFAVAPAAAAVVGEASTGYSKLPRLGPTPQRIRETLGAPKLIYLVRDPVERAISNYRHAYGQHADAKPLAEVIADDPIVVTASRYADQIEAYTDEFGADGLLILTTDELHRETTATMQRVERFLGLRAFDGWPQAPPPANSRQSVAQWRALDRWLPGWVKRFAKRIASAGIRGRLRSLVPVRSEPLPVTPAEVELLQDQVSDDLARLVEILGDRIAGWPSVKRLRQENGGVLNA